MEDTRPGDDDRGAKEVPLATAHGDSGTSLAANRVGEGDRHESSTEVAKAEQELVEAKRELAEMSTKQDGAYSSGNGDSGTAAEGESMPVEVVAGEDRSGAADSIGGGSAMPVRGEEDVERGADLTGGAAGEGSLSDGGAASDDEGMPVGVADNAVSLAGGGAGGGAASDDEGMPAVEVKADEGETFASSLDTRDDEEGGDQRDAGEGDESDEGDEESGNGATDGNGSNGPRLGEYGDDGGVGVPFSVSTANGDGSGFSFIEKIQRVLRARHYHYHHHHHNRQ